MSARALLCPMLVPWVCIVPNVVVALTPPPLPPACALCLFPVTGLLFISVILLIASCASADWQHATLQEDYASVEIATLKVTLGTGHGHSHLASGTHVCQLFPVPQRNLCGCRQWEMSVSVSSWRRHVFC